MPRRQQNATELMSKRSLAAHGEFLAPYSGPLLQRPSVLGSGKAADRDSIGAALFGRNFATREAWKQTGKCPHSNNGVFTDGHYEASWSPKPLIYGAFLLACWLQRAVNPNPVDAQWQIGSERAT